MSKLVINLKQHTPIIHFQHNQKGATLRATELKPKLDKFLIKYAFNDEFDKYKIYLKGYKPGKTEANFGDKKAFDYKVNILFEGKSDEIDPDKICRYLYLGNMGKKSYNEKTQCIFTKDNIKVEIISLYTQLINNIEQWIVQFFAVTNFGARQNKGFGSFFVSDKDSNILEYVKRVHKHYWYISYPPQVKEYKQKFNDLNIIYALMKRGINFPENPKKGFTKCYYKSFLFKYMLNHNIGNEKRFIKENFNLNTKTVQRDKHVKKYVRAMLGVADGLEFRKTLKEKRDGYIKYDSEIVDRFKSPITFKVVNNYLIIIPEEMSHEIFNQDFTYYEYDKDSKNKKESERILSKKISIKTPSKDQFNLFNFMDEFIEYFNKLQLQHANNPLQRALQNAKRNKIKIFNKEGR